MEEKYETSVEPVLKKTFDPFRSGFSSWLTVVRGEI